MAVNLSPRQFADPQLLDDIAAVLAETGLAPHLLELEITESMVMQNAERSDRAAVRDQGLGVSIAIDDFGTGYSSLSYLQTLPDRHAEDRPFVRPRHRLATRTTRRSPRRSSCSAASSSLTRRRRRRREPRPVALLREQGCDEMQGYHFSKPLVPEQFASLMRRHRPDPV